MEGSITVFGSNGSIILDLKYMNLVEYFYIGNYTIPEPTKINGSNDNGPFKGIVGNHHFVIENVVNTLREKGSSISNVEEGLKALGIINRIYKSRNLKIQKKRVKKIQ
jgi:predicted dehydrogenase